MAGYSVGCKAVATGEKWVVELVEPKARCLAALLVDLLVAKMVF